MATSSDPMKDYCRKHWLYSKCLESRVLIKRRQVSSKGAFFFFSPKKLTLWFIISELHASSLKDQLSGLLDARSNYKHEIHFWLIKKAEEVQLNLFSWDQCSICFVCTLLPLTVCFNELELLTSTTGVLLLF